MYIYTYIYIRVRKHETQSNRESCVFHFSHFELYFALHSCVLSTFQKHLLLFPTIIMIIIIMIIIIIIIMMSKYYISWIIKTEVWVICRNRRLRQITGTKFDKFIISCETEFNKSFVTKVLNNLQKKTPLWVRKSLRTLLGRGAWKLGRLWTRHDNPILGYHVNFRRMLISAADQLHFLTKSRA